MMPPARKLFDAEQVRGAYDRMAETLNRRLPDSEILLLAVMNGGMFPACELARRIKRRLRIDYVHATRYRGATEGAAVQWLHWPELPPQDRTVVLVDDIFDEGHTLAAIRQRLPSGYEVHTVTLVRKMHRRGLARDWVDIHGLDVEDVYVFGCGMDYRENFRELTEIWALAESSASEESTP